MRFPALFSSLRRFGRWAVLEICHLLLWAGSRVRPLADLRSAWGGGGGNGPGRPGAPAVRPRRPGVAGGRRGQLPYAAAA